MPPKAKTEADLRAWEAQKGFEGVLVKGGAEICRKCAKCDQPTKGFAEAHCAKDGGTKRVRVRKECQVQGCPRVAGCAKGTRCQSCWVAEDPAARGCPACRKQLKSMTRPDGLCSHCVSNAAVEARRNARREELARLCADEGIEAGAPDGALDAAFRTRYAVPNVKDDFRPRVMVRVGKAWKLACAVRGCVECVQAGSKGTRGTHCQDHGGGKCTHGRRWVDCLQCNPKIAKRSNRCSRCVSVVIRMKRQTTHGGCGLCSTCEEAVDAEAAAAAAAEEGKPPQPAAKKQKVLKEHELKMLERLILSGYVESTTKGVAPRPGEFIREVYVDYRCALAREFAYGEKQCAYVDFVVHPKRGGKLVFLEVDEGEHKFPNYTVLCDTTRMWNVCASLKLDFSGDKNVLWLRLNPNTMFAIGDAKHRLSNTARCDAVCALLDAIEGRPEDPPMQVAYACYQMRADGAPKILDDPDYHADVRPGVLPLAHAVDSDGALRLSLSATPFCG
jgi:hypothetical protein